MTTQHKHLVRHAMICLLLAGSVSGHASADTGEFDEADLREVISADPDNAARTFKAGDQAQKRRFNAGIEDLDAGTRALVKGETVEAHALRESGNDARHRRMHTRQMDEFKRLDAGHPASSTPRGDVERLGHHPRELNRMQQAGDAVRARRGYPERSVAALAEGRAPEADELQRRGEIDRAHRAHGVHAEVDTPRTGSRTVRAARLTGGVVAGAAAGAAVGWAVETATGVHTPDPLAAAKWTGDTLQRPQEMPRRLGELGRDGLHAAGKLATSLTRPDRMAVNVAYGGAALARESAYMVMHPQYAVTTVGNTAVALGNTTVAVGTGLAKGTYTVAKAGVNAIARPDRTVHAVGKGVVKGINKAGCGLGKLFRPGSRC